MMENSAETVTEATLETTPETIPEAPADTLTENPKVEEEAKAEMTTADIVEMFQRGDAQQVTAEDMLSAIAFRAAEDPKTFDAKVVQDMLTGLGFAEIWESATEQVLMIAAMGEEATPDDPDPDDELDEPEATEPGAGSE
jgi:hypothetical protein